jgi:hypothetical protein
MELHALSQVEQKTLVAKYKIKAKNKVIDICSCMGTQYHTEDNAGKLNYTYLHCNCKSDKRNSLL